MAAAASITLATGVDSDYRDPGPFQVEPESWSPGIEVKFNPSMADDSEPWPELETVRICYFSYSYHLFKVQVLDLCCGSFNYSRCGPP